MQCQLCSSFRLEGFGFSSRLFSQLKRHIQCHQKQILLTTGNKDEYKDIFLKCFPSMKVMEKPKSTNCGANPSAISKASTKNPGDIAVNRPPSNGPVGLEYYCRSVVLEANLGADIVAICAVCGWKPSRAGPLVEHLLDHAFKHSKQSIACGHCETFSTNSPISMKYHAVAQHRVCKSVAQYVVERDVSEERMRSMIGRCFGIVERGKAIKKEAATNSKSPGFRARATPTTSPAVFSDNGERRQFAKLTRQISANGKIECSQCGKKIASNRCDQMIDHALQKHFGKRLFSCRICFQSFTCCSAVGDHLRNCHQRSAVNGYVNSSPKYNTEIKKLLIKCYGGDEESESEEDNSEEDSEAGQKRKIGPVSNGGSKKLKSSNADGGKSIGRKKEAAVAKSKLSHTVPECSKRLFAVKSIAPTRTKIGGFGDQHNTSVEEQSAAATSEAGPSGTGTVGNAQEKNRKSIPAGPSQIYKCARCKFSTNRMDIVKIHDKFVHAKK